MRTITLHSFIYRQRTIAMENENLAVVFQTLYNTRGRNRKEAAAKSGVRQETRKCSPIQ